MSSTGVVCSACGKVSADPEFCDHCNAELHATARRLPPQRCPLTSRGVRLSDEQVRTLARPGASVELRAEDQRWRVRWVPAESLAEMRPLIEERQALATDVLSPCRSAEGAHGRWVFCEASEHSEPWHATGPTEPLGRLAALADYADSLARALEELHRHGYVWLSFDPAGLEDAGPAAGGLRRLRFANLDLRLFRFGELPEALHFNGKFVAPEVSAFHPAEVGPATDVFHLALFAYYWLADLLPQGFPGGGLEGIGHRLPPLRVFAPSLPEGITPVLLKGLAPDPARRYATPSALVAELRASITEAARRRRFNGHLHWDAAGLSREGRAKAAAHRGNEDHCLVRSFPDGPALLAAVADGISTCDVGSGALASLITMIVVENVFDAGSSHESFPAQAAAACGLGARRLLDWALEKGYGGQLALGMDLMGTTLTLGWLQGRELSLANLGDSRAYLVTDRWVEQLTVDSDVANDLLKSGTPPEQVRDLGNVARALHACVGGCALNNGALDVLPESSHPSLSRWPLVPGDVVVLCSDGLVDEGFFLEPAAMAELVRADRHLTAGQLAAKLVDAADALQRLPSEFEPEGFGDNITCVVIKIEAA